ncbi:hypothetical protein ACQ86G_12745 [Roseateles chitinivorans]|uniref:hypothetical protein n=1 Tax=Roseateles chitinivorans TaxID=2917965 RepID=UPI003D66FF6B
MSALLREAEIWSPPQAEGPLTRQSDLHQPPWLDGIDSLLHLLRYPERTHPYVVGQIPAPQGESIDWLEIRDLFCELFEAGRRPCMDAYLEVRLALGVLWKNSVRLCPGPAAISHLRDEGGELLMHVDFSVDTDSGRAYDLGHELMEATIRCYARKASFVIAFRSIHPHQPRHGIAFTDSTVDDDEDEE